MILKKGIRKEKNRKNPGSPKKKGWGTFFNIKKRDWRTFTSWK